MLLISYTCGCLARLPLHNDGPSVVGGGAASGVVDLAAVTDGGGGSGGGGACRGRGGRQTAAEITEAVIAQLLVDPTSSLNYIIISHYLSDVYKM